MRGLAIVVGFQSGFQIVGDTDVSLSRVGDALDEVDVFHIASGGEAGCRPPTLRLPPSLKLRRTLRRMDPKLSAQREARTKKPAFAEAMAGKH